MATILSKLKQIESVNTDEICIESMEATTSELQEKNKEQIYSGEQKDGGDIVPPYRPLTVFLKQRKGQPYDRVTLHDTGQFYSGIRVTVSGDSVDIDSTDSKSKKLQEKYGEQIFGLNDKYRMEFVQQSLKPAFKEKIEAATGLKFK